MIVSSIPIWIVLIWAIFATGFCRYRYRDFDFFKNPWTLIVIFVVSFFLFAYSAVFLVATEWFNYQGKKNL